MCHMKEAKYLINHSYLIVIKTKTLTWNTSAKNKTRLVSLQGSGGTEPKQISIANAAHDDSVVWRAKGHGRSLRICIYLERETLRIHIEFTKNVKSTTLRDFIKIMLEVGESV